MIRIRIQGPERLVKRIDSRLELIEGGLSQSGPARDPAVGDECPQPTEKAHDESDQRGDPHGS